MTHPDIKYIERYGYTRGELTVCFVILNAAITTMKLIHRSKCE